MKSIQSILKEFKDNGGLLTIETMNSIIKSDNKELIEILGDSKNFEKNLLELKEKETRLKPYVSEIVFENGINEVTVKTVKKQIEAKVGDVEYILIEFLDAYEGIDKILEGKFGVVLKDVVTNDAVQFIDEECRIKSGFKLIKGFTIKDSDVTSDSCNRTIVICNESGDITEFNNAEADKLIAMSRR